jgi:hypothetical protein
MDDAYDVSLWDIYPSCQTAGIGEDNTIIVDGARGANVRWKSFASVHVRRQWSWTRMLFRFLLHTSSLAFIFGVVFLWVAHWIKDKELEAAHRLVKPFQDTADNLNSFITEGIKKELQTFIDKHLRPASEKIVNAIVGIVVKEEAVKTWGVIFMLWSVPMMVFAPLSIRTLYGGKLWNTQPWLFGFEGYLPIEQIEYLIFGDQKGRLQWHPFGSPLSKHKSDENYKGGHCDPIDPTTDPEVKQLVEDAKTSKLGDQKVRL